MTSIDDCPNAILEEIFSFVPRPYRLTCKEVCKRWYNILMESTIFREDRHIFLNIDKISAGEASICALMHTKPYQFYTLDDFEYCSREAYKFFKYIGTSIEELISNEYYNTTDILTTMPLLKSLTFKYLTLKQVGKSFSSIKDKYPGFVFRNLEKLQVACEGELHTALSSICNIKRLLPGNCTIILSKVFVCSLDRMEHLSQILDDIKINDIISKISIIQMEKLIETNNIKCDNFILHSVLCHCQPCPYVMLKKLQNKNPRVKNIKLFLERAPKLPPIGIDLTKLTFLLLDVTYDVPFLKPLEQLQNLECLEIRSLYCYDNICRFGHDSLFMPKLKILNIKIQTMCDESLEALANSFENLTNIKFNIDWDRVRDNHFSWNWNKFRILISNWKYIETIETSFKYIEIEEEDLDLSFEPKEHLRSLKVSYISNFRIELIKKMSESFPNLETLELHTSYSQYTAPLFTIIQAVLPSFTKLTEFYFKYRPRNGTYEDIAIEFDNIRDYLGRFGLPIEDRKYECGIGDLLKLTINRDKMTSHISGI